VGGSCRISAGSLTLADGTAFLRTACRVKSVFGLKRLIGEMYIEEIIFQQTEATVLDQRKKTEGKGRPEVVNINARLAAGPISYHMNAR